MISLSLSLSLSLRANLQGAIQVAWLQTTKEEPATACSGNLGPLRKE